MAREDVACLIGYEKGSYGFRVAPAVLTAPAEADRLIFSPLCVHNLVNYLTLENIGPLTKQEIGDRRIAIVVKGCDSRALAMLMSENGVARDKLVIIGVCSSGVADIGKLEKRFPQAVSPALVEPRDGKFVVTCEEETTEMPAEEFLSAKCKRCKSRLPVIYDELVGEPEEGNDDDFSDVSELVERSTQAKQEKWENEFSKCIRCYACRNVCPLCYCEDCALDRLRPQFIRRSVDYKENLLFHITRAFHLAGRCIDCGECERACPQAIPLMELNRKLSKDVKELFDYEAGVDPQAKPLFATFKADDPEEGIL